MDGFIRFLALALPKDNETLSLLIVPTHHIDSIQTMTPMDIDVVGRCRLAVSAGIAWTSQLGPEGGQVVPHVHFHFLAGRRAR